MAEKSQQISGIVAVIREIADQDQSAGVERRH